MEMDLSRLALLLGEENTSALRGKKIALFGVGGVGSYALEALARCGIGGFILVDGDTVDPTNINRQLIALRSTLGRAKVDAARERLLDINPDAGVQTHFLFYLPDTADTVDLSGCDYMLDAVDTVAAKLHIVQRARALGIPVLSAMGAGNRLLSLFEVADIYDTSVCPLCRVMRRELRARGIPSLKVVYSRESPLQTGEVVGSSAFAPAVCGLTMAAEAVKDLLSVRGPFTAADRH